MRQEHSEKAEEAREEAALVLVLRGWVEQQRGRRESELRVREA